MVVLVPEQGIFLRKYKVMSVSEGQYYVQMPPSFVRTHNIQRGQRMFCYMSSDGDLFFKKTESPHNDHVMLNVYKVQMSGVNGFRLKMPCAYRDAFNVTDQIKVLCFLTFDGNLMYKPDRKDNEND